MVTDISNNRGAHRAVTDLNEHLITTATHCEGTSEAVRGRRRGFNIQRHGVKPFTKRKGQLNVNGHESRAQT
jgi:hypothetical protein